jgi:two-component system cell cycle response regulator
MAARGSTLERWLSVAAVGCLALVVLRNVGVVPPVLANVWDKAYNGAEFLAIAVCALRARRSPGKERLGWALLALGLLGYAAGDVYYTVALMDDATPPYPSLADVGYLSVFPAAYVGLVLLLRASAPRMGSALWLDGLVCGLAGAAIGAALVFGVVASTDGSLSTVATNLAYPVGDLLLLAFVIAVMVLTGRTAGATWRLLALAFGTWAVADVIYLYQTARGSYQAYTLLDTCWPFAYVLIGLAARQPSVRLDTRKLRGGILAVPATFTLIALGLLIYDHYARLNDVALWLAAAAGAAAVLRFAMTFRENLRNLGVSETEAATDVLTGLGNRRALLADLERHATDATAERPVLLALFDLDGFKAYNDSFGHPAGDALLARLGQNLAHTVANTGAAYRMGGDEFCLLVETGDFEALLDRAGEALSESGERFAIRSSQGSVILAGDGTPAIDALRIADQRMYADKRGGRRAIDETVHQVLLRVAAEHDGELSDHVNDVADLVDAVGRELALSEAERIEARRAATLHDIGKVAIPDAILHAPRALDAAEWEYMRQHTVIGERIIAVAPELRGVGRIVRFSHERWDGGGYPDGICGTEIPLGARIVAVCDAFDAMTTNRSYREARPAEAALDELERCAGAQFDPDVVAAFVALMRAEAASTA